jgi:hypothetical protein
LGYRFVYRAIAIELARPARSEQLVGRDDVRCVRSQGDQHVHHLGFQRYALVPALDDAACRTDGPVA